MDRNGSTGPRPEFESEIGWTPAWAAVEQVEWTDSQRCSSIRFPPALHSPPPPFLLPLSIPIRERRHRHGFVQFWQAAGVAPKMSQRLEQQRRRHLGACSCYGLEGGGCRGRGDRSRHSGKALKSLDIPVQKCLFLLFTLMRSAINRRRLPSTRAYVYIPCLYPT